MKTSFASLGSCGTISTRELGFELLALRTQFLEFFFGELAQLCIPALAQQAFVGDDVVEKFAIAAIGVDGLFELRALFDQRRVARLIKAARGIGQLRLDLVEAPDHRLEACDHACV